VFLYNQYGARIDSNDLCEQQKKENWTVTISPVYNADMVNNPAVIGDCDDSGKIPISFNATYSNVYTVNVFWNGSTSIANNPFALTVVATNVDPSRTVVSGLPAFAPYNGSFDLLAFDVYGNPFTSYSAGLFTVGFAPSCADTNITCVASGDKFSCFYVVATGGTYCVEVNFQDTMIPVPNSKTIIVGGKSCSSADPNCSSRGFCLPNNGTYSCNCFGGYAGSKCQYKISSHYVTVGATIGIVIGVGLVLFAIGILLGVFVLRRLRRGEDNRPLI